jgi:transcriptional regulator of acetoin/glycerol metabolism
MAMRHAGEEAESVAEEAIAWIERNLGAGYDWPGNYRELEQCVRNFIIRREYRPARRGTAPDSDLFAPALAIGLTAQELLARYCTLAYARTGGYEAAARKLGLDRRTVMRRVDRALLESLRGEAAHGSSS